MNMAERALALRKKGYSYDQIATITGLSRNSVDSTLWRARYPDKYREKQRARDNRRRRQRGSRLQAEIINQAIERAKPIIAAVDSGLSYSEVAKMFGLKSRSVVAGIVHRRPEARGANT